MGLSPRDVQLIDLQPQAILAAWERGDIDAAYTWLPTLDELRKTGKDLITSRQLATDGKPTLDLGRGLQRVRRAHPDVGRHLAQGRGQGAARHPRRSRRGRQGHRRRARAHPGGCARPAEAGRLPDPRRGRLARVARHRRRPGNIAVNLQSASQFLADQKQIHAAARPADRSRTPSTSRDCLMSSPSDVTDVARPGRPVRSPDQATCLIVRQGGDEVTALGPVDLDVDPGVVPGARRRLRLRQEHAAAPDRRLRVAQRGPVQVSGGAAPGPGAGGVVFQQPRLFPWRTVGGNVDLALKYARCPARSDAPSAGSCWSGSAWRAPPTARSGRSAAASSSGSPSRGRWPQRPAVPARRTVRGPGRAHPRTAAGGRAAGQRRVRPHHGVRHAQRRRSGFLGSRIVVLTRRPGQVALDLDINLPRTGVDPDELRALPEYAALRAAVSHAVRDAAG